MHKTMRHRLALVWALALATAGCQGPCDKIEPITAPALTSGSADFSSYVAAGTSISAGTQSGGTVDRHQVQSFTALFARQVGMTVQANGQGAYSFNPYNADGFPALSRIVSYSPLVVTNAGRTTGTAQNSSWPTSFRNMGVPFAFSFDFVDSTIYYAHPFADPQTALAADLLFNDLVRHRGTIGQQVLALAPTFITWEYGSNEVLGPTGAGVGAATTTGEQYAAVLHASLDLIHATRPGAKVAVVNIPDVTVIPLVRTLSPFTINLSNGVPVPLLGTGGALQQGDFVLLTAAQAIATAGTGIPLGGYNYLNPAVPGSGVGLPESVILRAAEANQTRGEVTQMNDAIAAEAAIRPYVAVVDFNAGLNTIAANGLTIGSNTFTTEYITGGLFSLDGAHPSDLGQAVICNTLIDAVNARFGSGVPRLDLMDWASPHSSSLSPSFPEGFRAQPVRVEGLERMLPQPVPARMQSVHL